MIRRTRRTAVILLVTATTALAAVAASQASPSDIQAARAEAESVLAQIQGIDESLDQAVNAYDEANYRLGELDAAIETNQRHLVIAKKALKVAQQNLSDRIVALYTSHEEDVISVILGAANLDDLLDRIDNVKRISSQDVQIIKAVRNARNDVQKQEKQLESDRSEQAQVVAERAAQQASIESQLAERQSLYNSIKDQISDLEAEERARQAQLAAEAEQRQAESDRVAQAASDAGVSVDEVTIVSEPTGIGTAPPSISGGSAVDYALSMLGVPYVWGGASPGGFDCSGLVVWAYGQVGVSLPHYTGALWNSGVAVSYESLQPGDLVFFHGLGHVGIYIGGGQMVHAPHTGDVVKISDISSGYYRDTYEGARRV
jgi:peptidoglycan DL-endopeptidase CwlO